MPDGLLLIDKPVGLRSTECVARVKRLLGKHVRVGHAGTLDSTASGLLILLTGLATRLSDYVMKLPKVYEAEICLGSCTDTCDYSGKIVFCGDATKINEAAFDKVLYSFLGTRMQIPPAISALKTEGQPFHRIARAGGEELPAARPVAVTSVRRCSSISEGRVKISVSCGKGTYIRAIVRDIGTLLGCGAHVAALRRLSIGPFHVADAHIPEMSTLKPEECLRSPGEVGTAFHRFVLSQDASRRLMNGLRVPLAEAGRYLPGYVNLADGICAEGENMIGFADIVEDMGEGKPLPCLKPRANIPAAIYAASEGASR